MDSPRTLLNMNMISINLRRLESGIRKSFDERTKEMMELQSPQVLPWRFGADGDDHASAHGKGILGV